MEFIIYRTSNEALSEDMLCQMKNVRKGFAGHSDDYSVHNDWHDTEFLIEDWDYYDYKEAYKFEVDTLDELMHLIENVWQERVIIEKNVIEIYDDLRE